MRKGIKNKNEILQDWVEQYRQEHGVSSVNLKEASLWMIRQGWQPKKADAAHLLAKELQIALREQFITDPDGNRIRQKHPQKIIKKGKDGSHEQYVLWHDIQDATRPQMQAAFQQRRFGVALDCRRLKVDVDSYNKHYNKSVAIQLVLDFTEDVEELEQERPEDHDPEDDDI